MVVRDGVFLRLLGPLDVLVDDRPVHAGGPKQRALLGYLVLHAGQPVSIPALIEAVWGEEAPDEAIRSVRTYVSNLRRLLGPAVDLRGDQGTYQLDIQSLGTDIATFRATVADAAALHDSAARSSALRDALDLWRGPVLADVSRPWVAQEFAGLDWEHRRAVAAWADASLEAGEPADVIPVIEEALAEAPLDEQLGGLLMRGLYGCGRQADALAVYRRLRDDLARELGVEPGPELRALEDQILLHDEASIRGTEAHWLPAPTAGLVGRTVEIEDLLTRLEQVRLLTLTGPGGVGKTRLAMEAGRRMVERGEQPVFFADLSTVFDESSVDAILASSARVQPHPDSGLLASLIDYLRPRKALLIVDNCEHLASTVARSLAALIRSCPQVTVLATSRAPLHIDGELEWRTPSLPIPDQDDAHIDVLRDWPAVELLLSRAPNSFVATAENRRDVVQLCARLDGLPLALELAASRLGSMTPAEIIATLGSHSQMLRGNSSTDDRHETLDATIGWSYELLPEEPRRLLDRLGVMSGGFLFEDVLAVCALQSSPREAVWDWLSSLVDQSLVMADTSGDRTRYRLLETIRRFALAHLQDDEPEVRTRHARHYGERAEVEAARLLGSEEGDAAVELAFAFDNLRSAIMWAIDTGDVDSASRIVASIADGGYWRSRYELSVWAQWVWEAITPDHPRWRAVCGCAARGAWIAGRFGQAVQLGEAAATTTGTVIARSGHPDDVVADIALYCGEAPTALVHYSQVAAQAEQAGDLTRQVWATYYVAVLNAVLRRPSAAVEAATKALAGARETGNPSALSFCLYANALACKHRSPATAVGMFEEAVRMADSVGNDWFGGIARMELASTKASHDDLEGGLRDFSAVVDHWHRAGDDTQLRLTWRYLVSALVDAGRHGDAAVLAGALVTDTRSALTQPHPKLLEDLRGVLGEAEYGRLTVRGSIMSVPELVVTSLDAIQQALRVHPGS